VVDTSSEMDNHYHQPTVFPQTHQYQQFFHNNGEWVQNQHMQKMPVNSHLTQWRPGQYNNSYPAQPPNLHQKMIRQNGSINMTNEHMLDHGSKQTNILSPIPIQNYCQTDPRCKEKELTIKYPYTQQRQNHNIGRSKYQHYSQYVQHQQHNEKWNHSLNQYILEQNTKNNKIALPDKIITNGKFYPKNTDNSQILEENRTALDQLDDFLSENLTPLEQEKKVGPCLGCSTLDRPLCQCEKFAFCSIFCQMEADHHCSSIERSLAENNKQ